MLDTIIHGYADQRSALNTVGGIKQAGALTLEQVERDLFGWTPVVGELTATALTPDGVVSRTVPKKKVIFRDDTWDVVGVVGDGFALHPYDEWITKALAQIVDGEDVTIQAAGTANGGAQAFVQIAAPENLVLPGGLEIRPFILAATALDGSLASTFKRNCIAIICENTYRASLKRSETMDVRIRHTVNSVLDIDAVKDVLGILAMTGERFAAEVEELLGISVTDRQFERIVEGLVAPTTDSDRSKGMAERKKGELVAMWRDDPRAATWKGTAFGAMQALSTWQQHVATVKGGTRTERNASNLMLGISDKRDLSNFDRIMAAVA